MAKQTVGVRLDPELVDWIDRRAARKGRTRSQEVVAVLTTAMATNPEPKETTP